MVVRENVSIVRDEKATPADGLIARWSEESILAWDGSHNSDHGRAYPLRRLRDRGLDIRCVKHKSLARICVGWENFLHGCRQPQSLE